MDETHPCDVGYEFELEIYWGKLDTEDHLPLHSIHTKVKNKPQTSILEVMKTGISVFLGEMKGVETKKGQESVIWC